MKFPNVEAERARNGMTKEALAKAVGVSYRTLYNWLKSGSIPSRSLQKMAELFGCTESYLLGREE